VGGEALVVTAAIGVHPDDLAAVVDAVHFVVPCTRQGIVERFIFASADVVDEAVFKAGSVDVTPTIWPLSLMPRATVPSVPRGSSSVL